MKRIILMLVVGAGLLIPSGVLVGQAGAANPHGDKGDPSSSCGGSSGSKPPGCDNANLPQSNGCNENSSAHNPHCEPAGTTTPGGSTTPSDLAGANTGGGNDNQPAGTAALGGDAAGKQLPFTGTETLWLTLFGAAMLASGLALRAHSRDSA